MGLRNLQQLHNRMTVPELLWMTRKDQSDYTLTSRDT